MIRSKIIMTIFSITLFSLSLLAQEGMKSNEKEHHGIEWMTFEEALKKHEEEPRKWVIDVWTDWCGWCKRMEKTTFSDSLVGDLVNEHFYAVSFDAEFKEEIEVGGQTYKFVEQGRRGYHELAATLLNGKMSYPTVVFLDEELKNLQPLPGYRTAEDFYPIVSFFNEYDGVTTWDEFMEDFESPYKTVEKEE